MSDNKKLDQHQQKFILYLVGRDLKLIENYCRELSHKSHEEGSGVEMKGVRRYPVKKLCITTRKSPCGNGTNTWDRFELRLYKRSFDATASQAALGELLRQVKTYPAIQVQVQAVSD